MSNQNRQPSGVPTGGQFTTGSRDENTVDLSDADQPSGQDGHRTRLSIDRLNAEWQDAFNELKAAGVEHDADHPAADRYRDASDAINRANRKREGSALIVLDDVARTLSTTTNDRTTDLQARATLARLRTWLTTTGWLSDDTGPGADRIDRPFAGTTLESSDELAASFLQLQGDGERYALILPRPIYSHASRRHREAAVLLQDGEPVVYVDGQPQPADSTNHIWQPLASGTGHSVDEVKELVAAVLQEAEAATRNGPRR